MSQKKTRPQFLDFDRETNSMAYQLCSRAIRFRAEKVKIVAVSFFVNFLLRDFFFEFDLTLRANNSTLKTAKPKKYHIFGILGT